MVTDQDCKGGSRTAPTQIVSTAGKQHNDPKRYNDNGMKMMIGHYHNSTKIMFPVFCTNGHKIGDIATVIPP